MQRSEGTIITQRIEEWRGYISNTQLNHCCLYSYRVVDSVFAGGRKAQDTFSPPNKSTIPPSHSVTHKIVLKFDVHVVTAHHLTAKFCTSPFLSSTSLSTLCTTFFSLSSSSLMESFCSSVIRSLVAMKRKSLSTDPICSACVCVCILHA